ncbi:MAG: hypothetical protein GKR93_10865 [Gammaproteobacteria bacterium]|nr:hypothetical protein [Gammaproteobacteria bacterium]
MIKYQPFRTSIYIILLCLSCAALSASEPEKPMSLETQVEGLWSYTGLTTSDGKELPLYGVFLLKNGKFIQYAVFKGEPFEDQGSMAHTGTYSELDGFIHLKADQTLSTSPKEETPLQSRGETDHDLSVERSGNDLTLVFSKGTGTIQLFELISSGSGDFYWLENGALTLVDGHFILVDGNESKMNAGYGSYKTIEGSIEMNIERWTNAAPDFATNISGTSLKGSFDGKTLTLNDGRVYKVKP